MSDPSSYSEPVYSWTATAAPRAEPRRFRQRYWLHALLFLLTVYSTTLVGARLSYNFAHNRPSFDMDTDLPAYTEMWAQPRELAAGLPFSFTLLTILLAHEFGHYLACVHYGIDASLPYFLPAPTLIGTLGAFIRIRSPISGVDPHSIYLHPIGRAAWIGVFATALNLLPIGQLDGGHILYAFVGEKHKRLSRVFLVLLIPLGLIYWWVWLFWAVVLFFLASRHPVVYDEAPLGGVRSKLGLLSLLIFLLSFMASPIVTN
jgi:membrane-associated protease RseP (regulator of RpoE activity)